MKLLMLAVLLVFVGGLVSASAGDKLSLRLVEASQDEVETDSRLDDIKELLTKNLPFRSFKLLDSKSMAVPANNTFTMSGGYEVSCKGAQSGLEVRVVRRREELVRTTVTLKDRTPLVIAGFPSDRGRLLLVLLAH